MTEPPAPPLDEDGIRRLVHGFYDAVRSDDLLGPVFRREIPEERWPEHLETLCAFWSSALLRTSRYDGRPLQAHLRLQDISETHFERWLALFSAAAARTLKPEVAEHVVGMAHRIAQSFRMGIAFHRGESLKPAGR
ncbi:group III truncated hemoglobin [Rhodovarius crocodyli]|uniref:Group III truncated hemoglobin n=2 Tax=Rhodovarius crocodyli TaxID=1979269 RepID=A0A437LXE1_9PROT|nr:group III truncated hemoglobin [Rhodovarius crocodyli]